MPQGHRRLTLFPEPSRGIRSASSLIFLAGGVFLCVISGLKRMLEAYREKWLFSGHRQGVPVGRKDFL
jgi:hypothetical protein